MKAKQAISCRSILLWLAILLATWPATTHAEIEGCLTDVQCVVYSANWYEYSPGWTYTSLPKGSSWKSYKCDGEDFFTQTGWTYGPYPRHTVTVRRWVWRVGAGGGFWALSGFQNSYWATYGAISEFLDAEIVLKGQVVGHTYMEENFPNGCADILPAPFIIPKNLGPGDGSCGTNPLTKNPINFATGNKYKNQVDLALEGPGIPFVFARHYNSQNEVATPMGYGWTHTFADYLGFEVEVIAAIPDPPRNPLFMG